MEYISAIVYIYMIYIVYVSKWNSKYQQMESDDCESNQSEKLGKENFLMIRAED